jgi:hypothetical protein
MRLRKTEEQEIRELLALRPTDDLTDDESRRVDEALVYSERHRRELADYENCLAVLQSAAAEPLPTDDRPSLWKRIEPQLGPARRTIPRRVFISIPTPWLTAAVFLLAVGNLYLLTIGQTYRGAERPLAVLKSNSAFVANAETPRSMVDVPKASGNETLVRYPVLVDPRDKHGRVKPLLGLMVFQRQDAAEGVEIGAIFEGTSAEEAGLQVGDVILEIDGKKIHDPSCVADVLKRHSVGQRIEILFQRDGHRYKPTVFLGGLVQIEDREFLIKKSPIPREIRESIDQQ